MTLPRSLALTVAALAPLAAAPQALASDVQSCFSVIGNINTKEGFEVYTHGPQSNPTIREVTFDTLVYGDEMEFMNGASADFDDIELTIKYKFTRPSLSVPDVRLSDILISANRFSYDADIPMDGVDYVGTIWTDDEEKLFTVPVTVKPVDYAANGADFVYGAKMSLADGGQSADFLEGFLSTIRKSDYHYMFTVNDPAKGLGYDDAILEYLTDDIDLIGGRARAADALDVELRKHLAGQC